MPLLRELIEAFKDLLRHAFHPKFPPGFEHDLAAQLRNAIEAVLDSWMSPTAVEARRRRLPEEGGVSDDMGTAVVIQEMVFGNRDDQELPERRALHPGSAHRGKRTPHRMGPQGPV